MIECGAAVALPQLDAPFGWSQWDCREVFGEELVAVAVTQFRVGVFGRMQCEVADVPALCGAL